MTDFINNTKIEEKLGRIGIQTKFTDNGDFVHVTIPYIDISTIPAEYRRVLEQNQKRLKLSFEVFTDSHYLRKIGYHKLSMRD